MTWYTVEVRIEREGRDVVWSRVRSKERRDIMWNGNVRIEGREDERDVWRGSNAKEMEGNVEW